MEQCIYNYKAAFCVYMCQKILTKMTRIRGVQRPEILVVYINLFQKHIQKEFSDEEAPPSLQLSTLSNWIQCACAADIVQPQPKLETQICINEIRFSARCQAPVYCKESARGRVQKVKQLILYFFLFLSHLFYIKGDLMIMQLCTVFLFQSKVVDKETHRDRISQSSVTIF